MKTKLFITFLLINCSIMLFAQDSTQHYGGNGTIVTPPTLNVPQLIADETWRTYLKTGAKVVTFSESVFKELSLRFGDQFSSIRILRKKDRHGEYKEYTMLMSTKTGALLTNWSKDNL